MPELIKDLPRKSKALSYDGPALVFSAQTALAVHSFFKTSAGLIFATGQLFQLTVMRASAMHEAPAAINIQRVNTILKANSLSHWFIK